MERDRLRSANWQENDKKLDKRIENYKAMVKILGDIRYLDDENYYKEQLAKFPKRTLSDLLIMKFNSYGNYIGPKEWVIKNIMKLTFPKEERVKGDPRENTDEDDSDDEEDTT